MRRAIIVCFLALTCGYIHSFAQSFGLPTWMDIATWSLTYPSTNCSVSQLPQSFNHRDVFVNTLQSQITTKYPSIMSTLRYKYENGAANLASFQAPNKDNCEVVYFVGHAAWDTHNPLFLNNTTCQYSNNFNFGGSYTKWAFIEACTVLNNTNPDNYLAWFNGVHAVFGFRSFYYQWDWKSSWWHCLWYGCDYSKSSDRWKFLWQNWFAGQEMWTAYSNAMIQNYNDATNIQSCPGMDYAVVQCFGLGARGDGTWEYIHGGNELVTHIFNHAMPTTSSENYQHYFLEYWNTTVGTPNYQ